MNQPNLPKMNITNRPVDGVSLTEKELKEIKSEVNKFMKSARKFLATKAGGEVPPEWELSLTLLESYYHQFAEINKIISKLPSLIIMGRYGEMPSPLLAVRDKASVRLEALMKQMGLSLKSALDLDVVEPQKELSPLDKFLNNTIEKR